MLPQAAHDVLVFADSDVSVSTDYLRTIVGELQKPGVGLVTCILSREINPRTVAASGCQWDQLIANTRSFRY
jgi:cellulose synthase/poly-beta-1,6-N-acetylglucosamine synthase-like glycosyltransferase